MNNCTIIESISSGELMRLANLKKNTTKVKQVRQLAWIEAARRGIVKELIIP